MSVDEPLDRFGEPLPPDPGYKEIWNADGTKPRSWEKLVLGTGLAIASDPANRSSVLTVDASASVGMLAASNVAALRDYAPAPHDGDLFVTRGYSTAGVGQAMYRWDAASTADDDGALTIKIASRATGRLKYVDLSGTGMFPLAASAIVMTGATNQTPELLALTTTLMTAGYRGMSGNFGTCKLSPGEGFKLPTRTEGVGFKFSKIKFTGTGNLGGPFGPWLYAQPAITAKTDTVLANAYEGVYCWNGAVTAGDDTFVGVEVRAGLSVGMTIIVYTGADRTNIGGADCTFYAKIKAITDTAGTTCTVQIDRVVPRTPPTCDGVLHSSPPWNENIRRRSTRHNFCPVTAFQDNLEFEDCTFDDCYPLMAGTRNARFIRTTVNRTYFAFRLDNAFDTVFDELNVYNLVGGYTNPPDYSDNYGFIFTDYGSYGTRVNNFNARNVEASGGVLDTELQGDGFHFTGTTRVGFSNKTDSGVHSGWFTGTRLTQEVKIDRLIVSGNGNVVNAGRVNIGHYECLGPPSMMTTDVTRIESLRWNGEEWNTPKAAMVELRGAAASVTTPYVIPVRGILRSLRIFAKSLTGIDDVLLVREDSGTYSVKSFVTEAGAGAWAECDRFVTSLGFSFGTFGGRVVGISLVTNGSWVPGNYLLADVQMLTPSRSFDELTYIDVSPPQKTSGQGRPSINAAFVGQEYTDNISGVVYASRSVGYGARDWNVHTQPAFGAYLSNSDQTLTPGGTVGEYINENGTQTVTRTKTISTSGAAAGDVLKITNYETSSHTMPIVNGGAGAGTIYTFAGTGAKQLSIVFDGTNWGTPTVLAIS